jgi:hypothetical protein
VTTLSYEDWLYRKADQYAHNEILAFLMMILGMISLIGGLNSTIAVSGQLLIPMIDQYPLNSSSSIGLVLTTAGFIVLIGGFVSTVYYDRIKSWHIGQIDKGYQLKNRKTDLHTMKETFERLDKKTRVRPEKEARARIRETQPPENPDFIVSLRPPDLPEDSFSSQPDPKKHTKTHNHHAERGYLEEVEE